MDHTKLRKMVEYMALASALAYPHKYEALPKEDKLWTDYREGPLFLTGTTQLALFSMEAGRAILDGFTPEAAFATSYKQWFETQTFHPDSKPTWDSPLQRFYSLWVYRGPDYETKQSLASPSSEKGTTPRPSLLLRALPLAFMPQADCVISASIRATHDLDLQSTIHIVLEALTAASTGDVDALMAIAAAIPTSYVDGYGLVPSESTTWAPLGCLKAAIDCTLVADSFESLLGHSILHSGDSESVAIMAAALYSLTPNMPRPKQTLMDLLTERHALSFTCTAYVMRLAQFSSVSAQ